MTNKKELAYRYDLIITPEWRERFDQLIDEHVDLPDEGQFLILNCGTGSRAIEIAERLKAGQVYALDPSPERIEIAIAKALVKKLDNIVFESNARTQLRFADATFDTVIGDGSLLPSIGYGGEIEALISEMLRVSRTDSSIVIGMATQGSFDEFFSIFWEALHDCRIDGETWDALERLLKARPTAMDAEELCRKAGLRKIKSVTRKEEFSFESGSDFIESPLIKDTFLDEWLSIANSESRPGVRDRILSIMDGEGGIPFETSIKATVISGTK